MIKNKKTQPAKKVGAVPQKGKGQWQIFVHVVVGVFVCGGIILVLFFGKRLPGYELHEGDIALRSIYSPYDFRYLSGIDEEQTEALRLKATREVLPVFDVDLASLESVVEKVRREFSLIAQIIAQPSQGTVLEEQLDPVFRSFLRLEKADELAPKIVLLLEELFSTPVTYEKDKVDLLSDGVKECIVRDPRGNGEKVVAVADIFSVAGFPKNIKNDLIKKYIPDSWRLRSMISELMETFIRPTIRFNDMETQARKQNVADGVAPVYQYVQVKKNEVIVQKGERITKEQIEKLDVLSLGQSNDNRYLLLLGICIFVSLLSFSFMLYLKIFMPVILRDNRYILLLGIIGLVVTVIARMLTLSPFPSYLIPTSIGSMLTTLLINSSVGIIFTVILALLNSFIAGESFSVFVVAFLGGVAAVYSIRKARIRSHVLRSGLLVGATQFLAIGALGLVHNADMSFVGLEGAWGCISGIVAAIIVTGILPVFEHVFKVTTNISLLELADLNHPVLKEMIVKAPGTYHHSLLVGNLVEAACDAVGANSLLARVAAYFHDIGKIDKAEYFSENQPINKESKHAKLAPSMSSLIIIQHVKAGLEIARKFRLPYAITELMAQHHGTSLASFFYQRALQKVKPEDEVTISEESFRYPGPKPQTREAAIVLLADSVEAASRALDDPTPASLKGLVRKIINNKFIDGQLDECTLTLRDLHNIADSFLHVLGGIYHSRIDYPEMRGQSPKQKKTEPTNDDSTAVKHTKNGRGDKKYPEPL
ncbi:MAG: HDIG domain-containing protein [Candidatus Omnitrophica bacterium]|nr:HDIG domain-containing protein [Candidatus Omnitrophota bacterium]